MTNKRSYQRQDRKKVFKTHNVPRMMKFDDTIDKINYLMAQKQQQDLHDVGSSIGTIERTRKSGCLAKEVKECLAVERVGNGLSNENF